MKPPYSTAPQTVSAGHQLWRRWGGLATGVALAAALAALLWYLLADTATTKREVAATPMLMLPPPPPPPPPPEPEKQPEPEKVEPQVVEPLPTPIEPMEQPAEDAPPSPSEDVGDPVTIDGEAQAGGDAFGIGAGRGGGSVGSGRGGLGNASYAGYVSTVLQRALARDPRTRQLVFDDIRLDLWLSREGRALRVELVDGTGDSATDRAVLELVRQIEAMEERPPASMRYPMRVSMKGRRP